MLLRTANSLKLAAEHDVNKVIRVLLYNAFCNRFSDNTKD